MRGCPGDITGSLKGRFKRTNKLWAVCREGFPGDDVGSVKEQGAVRTGKRYMVSTLGTGEGRPGREGGKNPSPGRIMTGGARLYLPAVLGCLAVLGVILFLVLVDDQPVFWFSVAILGASMILCESMGERMTLAGRSTYGIIVLFAALASLNTPSAMIVALCGGIRLGGREDRTPPEAVLFNGGMYALAVWGASATYHALGGASRSFTLAAGLKSILPALAAAAVFWALNAAAMAFALRSARGLEPVLFLRADAVRFLPNQLIYALVGLSVGVVYAQNAFHVLQDLEGMAVLDATGKPVVVGSTAEYLRGFFAVLSFTALLGTAWYFSGRNIELLESYDRSLETLVTYLERREPYLEGHAVRVAEYAVMIARRMKLPFYEVNRLRHAALLHDLGRAAVPRRVLLREGPLDEEEFKEVKKHPLEGSSRLEEVPYLSDMADAVRHHHEYYDGGGYVDHLARDTIPLGARIIAVADAYDAMTHPRPFREAKGHERAVAELRQNSGLQFDPEVVEHFLAALEEAGQAGAPAVEEIRPEEMPGEEGKEEAVVAGPRGARARRSRRARRREERLRERREARERLEREALRALEEGPIEEREEGGGMEPWTGEGASGAPEPGGPGHGVENGEGVERE